MELNEVVRRIVGQHWRLILVLFALGTLVGFTLHVGDPRTYTASTRLSLDTKDPESQAEAEAVADTADAIATSPLRVENALRRVHARRDPIFMAERRVAVQALGSGGVVELSVTDPSPRAAAAISNALAEEVIRARLAVTGDQLQKAVSDLSGRIASLNGAIARLDRTSVDATNVNRANSAADQTASARDSLIQERASMESARVSALSADSQRATAAVVSPAVVPPKADPSSTLADTGIGALLGLVLGLGLAALIETLRPTLVGREVLARELGTPVLGTVAPPELPGGEPRVAADVGSRLGMAAATAGVGKVALLPVTRGIEVERLAQAIDAPLQVQSFDALDPVVAENGNRTGLVLISPGTLRRDELDKVLHLLRVSPGPLLGLITYERERDPTTGLRPVFVRGRDEAKDAAGHVGDREPAS